jgi:hypothetical protein
MSNLPRNPIQPLITDEHGVVRFKANKIVQWLKDQRPQCLNEIASLGFTDDDHRQFAQLIGYSHSGSADLGYVDDYTWEAAKETTDTPFQTVQARCQYLENEIAEIRAALQEPIARLFDIHPENLQSERDDV